MRVGGKPRFRALQGSLLKPSKWNRIHRYANRFPRKWYWVWGQRDLCRQAESPCSPSAAERASRFTSKSFEEEASSVGAEYRGNSSETRICLVYWNFCGGMSTRQDVSEVSLLIRVSDRAGAYFAASTSFLHWSSFCLLLSFFISIPLIIITQTRLVTMEPQRSSLGANVEVFYTTANLS